MKSSQLALNWFRNDLSINEQNELLRKYFPNRDPSNVVRNLSNIEEMYSKELNHV
jgi:hypothetical protein